MFASPISIEPSTILCLKITLTKVMRFLNLRPFLGSSNENLTLFQPKLKISKRDVLNMKEGPKKPMGNPIRARKHAGF
jgi:hypothetical protein